jgi:aryl-alcohol dehydrogenase-like predicted oxidoreductase
VVVPGAVRAGQLAGNLAAARLSLADDELEELRTLAEPAEAYWAARGRLRWA